MKKTWIIGAVLAGCGCLCAQEQNPTATEHWPQNGQQPEGQTDAGIPILERQRGGSRYSRHQLLSSQRLDEDRI